MFTWKKKQGIPRNSWMQEAITEMREKGINIMGWINREEWSKTLDTEKCENIDPLNINK